MNEMPDQDDQGTGQRDLAYEFVIGVLPDDERQQVQRQRMTDPALDQQIVSWEQRLTGLDQIQPQEKPAPELKQFLLQRLFGAGLSGAGLSSDGQTGWWRSLALWRSFSAAGLAAMLAMSWVLVSGVPVQGPSSGGPVAGLPGAQPVKLAFDADRCAWFEGDEGMLWMVWMDSQNGLIQSAALKGYGIPESRDMELWALPEHGAPRSLGLLPAKGKVHGALSVSEMDGVKALAISEEPKGGSPSGAPTGPVRFKSKVWLIGA